MTKAAEVNIQLIFPLFTATSLPIHLEVGFRPDAEAVWQPELPLRQGKHRV